MIGVNLNTRINNIFYNFFYPSTIFQACLEKHVFIPRFCYHVSLKISGNCRMCLIEEKSSIKPLASCAVNLLNGMTIYTNTETVKKAREGVLEYLLINHPLDCPICDQGGECDLQDQSMVFGSDSGRFYEKKRSTPNKNFGFLIKTFLNRCIHCSRCTRFLQEIAGDNTIQLLGRGKKMEISNYISKFIGSEISGNIIDLCPVGALTSKPSAFKARIWELTQIYTYDINDGFAANIQIDFRGLEIIRILPKINKYLNEEWISDKTRFFFDSINNQRLTSSYYFFKNNNNLKINWMQSLTIIKNYILNTHINLEKHFPYLNLNFGSFLDFEAAVNLKFLQKKFLTNIDFKRRINNDFREDFYLDIKPINNFENNLNSIILFFLNLRFQSPIINIKIRKLTNNYAIPVYLIGFLSNANYNLIHLGTKIKKLTYNFIMNQNLSIYFSGIFLSAHKRINKIADFLSDLTSCDINLLPTYSKKNYLNISCGLVENLIEKPILSSPFSVELLHHIDDKQSEKNSKKFTKMLYLPTKFYFEKISNFVNNSFTFFDTTNHFSYTLPNTKEEWKILFAIYETVFCKKNQNKNTSLFYNSLLQKFLMKFLLKNKNEFVKQKKNVKNIFFMRNSLYFSKINDFFQTNIITKSSITLSLCSKRLTELNDYHFLNKSI